MTLRLRVSDCGCVFLLFGGGEIRLVFEVGLLSWDSCLDEDIDAMPESGLELGFHGKVPFGSREKWEAL